MTTLPACSFKANNVVETTDHGRQVDFLQGGVNPDDGVNNREQL